MNEQAVAQTVPGRSLLAQYISLSKPGIVGLTLVAALTGIYFGNHGIMPHWSLIAWTFLTLALATAGSCMLNNYYDRDIDRLMERTSKRVLAAEEISSGRVLPVSLFLIGLSLSLMAWTVNPLSAVVTAVGVFGYSVVYTMWMKRTTPWANQFGGIAGAVPPMIGYAAVTGELGAAAWILFAIMVVWQQPHALSLALKYREEYARAGVPVIPVAKGVVATKQRIVIYCMMLLPVSSLPWIYDIAGTTYLATSIVLGGLFLAMSTRFMFSEKPYNMRLFAYSIVYLILLFGSMVFDAL